jgi:hypothetical protein
MAFIKLIKTWDIKAVIILTIISVTWVNFNQQRWKKQDVIAHDIRNYYAYLPALFYEHDLSLAFLNDTANRHTEAMLYLPNRTPDGKPVIKMSMGMAVTYFPFFVAAHFYAKWFDYPVDGFSPPYHFALLFSSLFYQVIGLLFLWKVLRTYFHRETATLTTFCLVFSTNVFFYLTMAGALAHTIGFTLIAAFLYYTIKWNRQPVIKYALIIGLLTGLLTLVRPVNILVVLFFVLFPATGFKGIVWRGKFLLQQKTSLLVIGISAFAVVLPQLLYWKYVSGHFFFNSYVGEHFFFNNPHIVKALIGFRKGWLIYTPVMIFALLGYRYLRHELKPVILPLVCFLSIYVYVVFSWWCWWYGGSFGQRVMIDVYPLLALPFAAFIERVHTAPLRIKRTVYVSIGLFTCLNLFQSMQVKYNILHYDSMTARSYVHNFFSISKSADRENYLEHPDYDKAKRGEGE